MTLKNQLIISFIGTSLLAAFAYIQTFQFAHNFPHLAQTSIVQTLAPRAKYVDDMKQFIEASKPLKGKPNSEGAMCGLIGKYFNFDASINIPHPQMDAVYKSTLALCLVLGKGVEKDVPKALGIIHDLSENLNVPPKLFLPFGVTLIQHGVPEEGMRLLRRAYGGGDNVAGSILASYYMNGLQGIPPAWDKADEIFRDLAKNGDGFAALNVAFISLQGRLKPVDFNEFRLYLEQSLTFRKDKANILLQSWAYELGLGYSKDLNKARELKTSVENIDSKLIKFYVTDFYNVNGWGANPILTQTLLLKAYEAGILDLSGQRSYFFEQENETELFTKLKNDLQGSELNLELVARFINDFKNASQVKASTL